MLKCIFSILFISFYVTVTCQVIEGTIINKETKEVIPFAAIYYTETSYGVICDANGHFKIDITKYSSKPVTISALGFYSTTYSNFLTNEKIIIQLEPKTIYISEIEIKANSLVKQRKANLKLFKTEFLGSTSNANKCKILNEEDITFNYGSDKKTLKAFASKPIIIQNYALGYKITYYLDKFEYHRKSKLVFYQGNMLFEEDTIQSKLNKSKRKQSYYGSPLHLLRSLWSNELDENNFFIKDKKGYQHEYNNLVALDSLNRKYIPYNDTLIVLHNSEKSEMIFTQDKVYFDKDGFYSPVGGVIWLGYMGKMRISDMLPLEYNCRK